MTHRREKGSVRATIIVSMLVLALGAMAPTNASAAQTPEGFVQSWLILGQYERTGGAGPGLPAMRLDYLTDGSSVYENTIIPVNQMVVNTNYLAAASDGFNPGAQPYSVPTVFEWIETDDQVNYNDATLFGDVNDIMVYNWTYANNKTGSTLNAYLGVASDDSIQVVVNGVEFYAISVPRGGGAINVVQNAAPIVLLPGINLIMIKVFEGGGGFNFRFRLQTDNATGDMTGATNGIPESQVSFSTFETYTYPTQPTGSMTRTIGGQYSPGGAGVPITVTADATADGLLVLTETLPANVVPSNAVASTGTATIAGQTITWDVNLAAGETATLDYLASVAGSVCNQNLVIDGTFATGVWDLTVGGDTTLTQLSDGISNALIPPGNISWAGVTDIPFGLQPPGSTDFYACDGSYVHHAAGADIWGTADEMRYLYVYANGDFNISGTVQILPPNQNAWTKAGFMVRANLTQGSPFVFICVTNGGPDDPPANGNMDIAWQWRDTQGGGAAWEGAPGGFTNNDEAFLILRRTGATVTGDFDNVEGDIIVDWKTRQTIAGGGVDIVDMDPAQPNLVGLALTSHNAGNLANARFWNIAYTGLVHAATANVTRAVNNQYTPPATPAQVVLTADAIAAGPVAVTETLPAGLTAANIVASQGTTALAGQDITWNVSLTAGAQATLTYDAVPPGTACGDVYTLNGTYTMGPIVEVVLGDDQVTQAADGWENAGIPWTNSETIGDDLPLGRADWFACNDSYLLVGDGHDIWDGADDFHFLYATVIGDFSISATVMHLPPVTNAWAKAGLMVRANNTAGSPYIIHNIARTGPGTGNMGINWQWRDSQGAGANWTGGSGAQNDDDAFLILRRTGTTVTGDYDNNEGTIVIDWMTRQTIAGGGVDIVDMDPAAPNLVGLCLTSHNTGTLANARFTGVSLTGNIVQGPPDAPTNLAAIGAGTDGILLSWTDNANNETGFKLERKEGAAGTYAEIAQPGANATNYFDTGLLTDGTIYFYQIRATNAQGDSAYSNEASSEAGGALDATRWTLYR